MRGEHRGRFDCIPISLGDTDRQFLQQPNLNEINCIC